MNSKDNVRNRIIRAQGSENSAVLFVAGDNKMKDHANRTNIIGRARMLFMALLMVLTMTATAMSGITAYAANDTVYVATYDQLRVALEDTPGVKEVVVDPQAAVEEGEVVYSVEGDEESNAFYIGFDGPLTVSHDITITSADDVDVYFARSDSFRRDQGKPALLNVDSTGNLNLDGLITMTSEEVTTTFYEADEENPAEFVFSVKSKDGTGEDNEAWNRGQALKGGFYIQNNGGEYTLGDDVIMEDLNLADDVEDVEQIHEVEKTTLSNLFGSNKSEEEAVVEEETVVEEEVPVKSAPKRLMKSAGAPALRNGSTPNYTPNDTTDTKTVATSAQLEAALNDPAVTTIIVDPTGALREDYVQNKDANGNINPQEPTVVGGTFYLPVDKPLTIVQNSTNNRAVTIKTKEDAEGNPKEVVIARSDLFKPDKDNPAIFNVPKGVTLTLDSKITMTGDKVTSKYKNGTNSSYDPGKSYETTLDTGVLKLASQSKYLAVTKVGGVKYLTVVDSKPGNLELVDGFLNIEDPFDNNKKKRMDFYQKPVDTNGMSTDLRLVELGTDNKPKSTHATTLEKGKTYLIAWYSANKTWYYLYPDSTDPNGIHYSTDYSSAFRLKAVSDENDTEEVEDVEYAPVKFAYTVETPVWTKDEVLPGGYFIHAKDGGTVTLNTGVELKNLKTGPRVMGAAPVYIGGENNTATFNLDGAIISGNTIGYGPSDPTVFDETISDGPVVARGAGYAETGGVRKAIQDAAMTNTAGGVIFSGGKVTGNLNNGSIEGNKADAGGIIVKNYATVNFGAKKDTTKNPAIDSNIGWHHAGAAQVEDGGLLNMYGGHMNNNVAWYKGGAVVVTEFGTQGYVVMDENHKPKNRGTAGKFVMDGGTLDGNYAFVRAGAIEVESNGVVLKSGTISNNMCKSLGGAIYVEGDYSDYSYTLVINQGYIHHNTVVGATPDNNDSVIKTAVDRKLKDGALVMSTASYKYNVNHADADFPNRHSGNGGGVWLCPLGGTSIFSSNGDQEVVINNNTAYTADGRNRHNLGWGDDFYVSRGKGAALVQNLKGEWLYDRQPQSKGDPVGPFGNGGKVINGPIGMHNSSTSLVGSGIVITGNRARDGGGIAANGTVVMGVADDVYRFESIIDIDKEWIGVDSTNKSVDIELQYEYNGQKYRLTDYTASSNNTGVTQEYVISLDGNNIDDKQEGDVIYRNGRWKAQAMIPAFIYHGGDPNPNKIVHLYRIRRPGRTGNADSDFYDLTTLSGIEELHNDLDPDGDGVNNKPLKVEWNLFVKETVESVDGETLYTVEREIKSAVASTVTNPVTMTTPVTGTNGQTNGFNIYFTTVNIGQHLENSLKSTTVHLNKTGLGGAKLNGAEFALYKAVLRENGDIYALNGAHSDDNVTAYKTGITSSGTGTDVGKITISDIEPGAYLLFETKAADGYQIPKSPWFMLVAKDGTVTVTRMSDANQGKITNSDDAPYDVSGETETARVNSLNAWLKSKWWRRAWFNITDGSITSYNDGTVKPTNVTFVESGGQGVTLTANNGVTNLENEPLPIVLDKVDITGTHAVKGATFELFHIQGNGNGFNFYFVENGRSDIGNVNDIKPVNTETLVSSSEDGTVTLPQNIAAGKYFLFETSVPAESGTVRAKAPWLIDVTVSNGKRTARVYAFKPDTDGPEPGYVRVAGSGNSNKYEKNVYSDDVTQWLKDMRTSGEGTVNGVWWKKQWYDQGNQPVSGNKLVNEWAPVEITKVGLNSTTALGGAKFSLYKAVAGQDLYVGDLIKSDITSSSEAATKGKIELPVKDPGIYFLFETEAPSNFKRAESPWLVHVADDRTVTVVELSKGDNGNYGHYWVGKKTKGTYGTEANAIDTWTKSGLLPIKWWKKEWFNLAESTWTKDNTQTNQIVFRNSGGQGVVAQDNKISNEIEIEFTKVPSGKTAPELTTAKFDLYYAKEKDSTRPSNSNGNKYVVDTGAGRGKLNTTPIGISDGKYRLPIRESGLYMLFEVEAPEGYVQPKAPWGIRVDGNGNVEGFRVTDSSVYETRYANETDLTKIELECNELTQLTGYALENEQKPIELYKVDEKKDADGYPSDDAAKLSGATFKIVPITLDDGNWYHVTGLDNRESENITVADFDGTITSATGTDGKITIENLAAGKYFLFEIDTPAGFIRSTSPWVLEVQDDSTGRSWKLSAAKPGCEGLINDGDGAAGNRVDPAGTEASSQKIGRRWWEPSWFRMIYDSKNPDTPEGRLSNEPKYLLKVDKNNNDRTLPDAEFALYGTFQPSETTHRHYGYIRADEDVWKNGIATRWTDLKSDDNGRIQLPSVVTRTPGRYILIETKEPGGYKTASETKPWIIDIDSNGNISVREISPNATSQKRNTNYDWWPVGSIGNVSNKGIKITNEPTNVKLVKVDGNSQNHSVKLPGAEFELFSLNKTDTTYQWKVDWTDSKGKTAPSGDDGVFTLPADIATDLDHSFLMKEVRAPKGYALSSTYWIIQIEYASYYGYYAKAFEAVPIANKKDVYTWKYREYNAGCIPEIPNYPSVELWKIDGTAAGTNIGVDQNGRETITENSLVALENVKFDLWKADENWNKDGTEALKTNITSNSTDASKGKVEFGALSPGRYLIYETQAKDRSYVVPSEPWKLTVGSDGKISKLEVYSNGEYIETAHNKYMTNSKVYDLPKAGGMGTYWFMIIGAMMMGFALTAGFTKVNLLKLLRR